MTFRGQFRCCAPSAVSIEGLQEKMAPLTRLKKSYAVPGVSSIGFNVKCTCDLRSNGDRWRSDHFLCTIYVLWGLF